MDKLATRRLDDLRRIVLPKNGPEGWQTGTFIDIYMDGQNRLILDKSLERQVCCLCGRENHLYACNDYLVCRLCTQILCHQMIAQEEGQGQGSPVER